MNGEKSLDWVSLNSSVLEIFAIDKFGRHQMNGKTSLDWVSLN